MLRHQVGVHGAEMRPNFIMRAVKYHKTALYRQLGEAVRIRRRGGQGSILNSKAEYDRCYIPRLVVEEKDTKEQDLLEEQEARRNRELINDEFEKWDSRMMKNRREQDRKESSRMGAIETRVVGMKREQEQMMSSKKKKRSKKHKHEVIGEQWGRGQPDNIGELQPKPSPSPQVPREQDLPQRREHPWNFPPNSGSRQPHHYHYP